MTESVSWQLVVKYPCSNSDYITISGNAPSNQNYDLFTESLSSPLTFSHEPFTVALQASSDSTRCGTLSYGANIDGTSISDSTVPPIAYDKSGLEFQVFSEDPNFEGSKTLSIDGYLTLYT